MPDRLRLAMRVRGLSDAGLAEKTGLAELTILNIRLGRTANPSLKTMQKISSALEQSLDWLAGENQ